MPKILKINNRIIAVVLLIVIMSASARKSVAFLEEGIDNEQVLHSIRDLEEASLEKRIKCSSFVRSIPEYNLNPTVDNSKHI
jgi:hypothetical protein